jgi:DNA-binding MarR family transcriptional regulator
LVEVKAPSGHVSDSVLDAVLTASRTLIAVTTQSLGAAAEETTIAQYRTLVVLASRGPQRMVDLAAALAVTPSTAGRMSDRLVRKGLIRRERSRADRREVRVSITRAGRHVVDQATDRRRALLAEILGRLSPAQQSAAGQAFSAFAAAAGEVPDKLWPDPAPDPQAHRGAQRPVGATTASARPGARP